MDNNQNKNNREKITFIQGFNNYDSQELSKRYPNTIVFSEPEKYKDILFIKYIYKNGISYTPIQGVDPEENTVIIDNNNILLNNDNKKGLGFKIDEKPEDRYLYFYIGDNSIFSENSSINDFLSNYNNSDTIQEYTDTFKLIKNTFNNCFNENDNFFNFENLSILYLLIPIEWENHLEFSFNGETNTKNIFKFTIDEVEQIKRNIILKDGFKYNIYTLNKNQITITKSFV